MIGRQQKVIAKGSVNQITIRLSEYQRLVYFQVPESNDLFKSSQAGGVCVFGRVRNGASYQNSSWFTHLFLIFFSPLLVASTVLI